MRPSINEDKSFCSDWVFVNYWAAKERNIARGDIVVFNSPVGEHVKCEMPTNLCDFFDHFLVTSFKWANPGLFWFICFLFSLQFNNTS